MRVCAVCVRASLSGAAAWVGAWMNGVASWCGFHLSQKNCTELPTQHSLRMCLSSWRVVLHIHDHGVPPCAPQPTRPLLNLSCRFWMAFQQRSKLGLKGQVGVSRVTPSGVGSHTTTYVAREKAWILRATSSAFQYSAPMPPCRQRSPNRSHLIPSDSRPCLSALRSRQRRQILFQFCRRNLWFSRHPRRCPSR